MVNTVLELLVAPALVGAATLAARRWGPEIGGLVSAFPAIVGPVLLIAALEHGATFAARAANGTLLGLVALAAFAVAYGWTAARAGWRGSLAAGWAAAGLAGLLVGTIAAGPPAGLAAAAVSLGAAHRLLRHAARRAHPLGSSPGGSTGTARVVWKTPTRLTVVQCARVRRGGDGTDEQAGETRRGPGGREACGPPQSRRGPAVREGEGRERDQSEQRAVGGPGGERGAMLERRDEQHRPDDRGEGADDSADLLPPAACSQRGGADERGCDEEFEDGVDHGRRAGPSAYGARAGHLPG